MAVKKLIIFIMATGIFLLSQAAPSLAVPITLPNYGDYGTYLTNSVATDGFLLWIDDSSVAGDVSISNYYSLAGASDWYSNTDGDTYLFIRGDNLASGDGSWYLEFDGLANTRQYAGLKVEYAMVLDGELQDYGTYYRDSRKWALTDEFTKTAELEAAVPIPAAAWLLGAGLLGLIGIKRRMS